MRENVVAETYKAEDDTSRSEELAAQCRADGKAYGILEQELNEAIDDLIGAGDGLPGYIASAIEAATER